MNRHDQPAFKNNVPEISFRESCTTGIFFGSGRLTKMGCVLIKNEKRSSDSYVRQKGKTPGCLSASIAEEQMM